MKKVTRTKRSALVRSGGVEQSYTAWIADLKRRYRATQIKAAVAVNCVIIDKCKRNRDKALFYVRRTIQNGWSRNSLLNWLSTDLYEREGKAQTNFDLTMPSDDCDLARQLVKDPQKFEVLGSSFLHRAVASLSRRGGQDRQVRACRSWTAERLHGDCEACLEHAGRQPARRASHLQGTQPRPRQVPFGGTWPADGHHRLRAQEGPPHQGTVGQVRHRRRAADCRGFNVPTYGSVKLGHREMIE